MTAPKLHMGTFSLGWVLVCLLCFAGGLTLHLALIASFTEGTENWAYAALTFGTAIGGLCASRASSRSIFKEAVAAVVVMVSLLYFVLLSANLGSQTDIILNVLRVGGPSGLGAIVGTLFGWRNRKFLRSNSEWRWSGTSLLVTLGWMVLIYAAVLTAIPSMAVSESGGLNLLIMLGAIFLGGVVTQAIAPMQSFAICGAGGFWVGILAVVIAVSTDKVGMVGAIFGSAILSVLLVFVGAFGARIGYVLSGRKAMVGDSNDEVGEVELPTATAKES